MSASVSIVIPVYNVGNWLDSTLQSIRRQSFRQWELILIDDGSTDQSRDIAERHAAADRRIQIVAQENQGVSLARNRGLAMAQGEFVIFMDGDDLWQPDCLQSLIDKQRQCGAALVYGGQEHQRQDGSCELLTPQYPTGHILAAAIERDMVHIGASLIRREFLLKRQIQFTPFAARAQDVEFVWKILAVAAVEAVPQIVLIRRYRPGSATNMHWSRELYLQSLGCYERLQEFIGQHYLVDDKTKVLALLQQKTDFLRFRALWQQLKDGEMQQLRAEMQTAAGWDSLNRLASAQLTLAQKLQRRLLLARRVSLWRLYRRWLM